ncbi:tRNA pseudouridine(13) synthase TruD, partial [Pseudoalteromonas sp. S1649]
ASGDIGMSAPMGGKGEKGLTETEKVWLEPSQSWIVGLCEVGLKNDRRMLPLIADSLAYETIDDTTLKFSFGLP